MTVINQVDGRTLADQITFIEEVIDYFDEHPPMTQRATNANLNVLLQLANDKVSRGDSIPLSHTQMQPVENVYAQAQSEVLNQS